MYPYPLYPTLKQSHNWCIAERQKWYSQQAGVLPLFLNNGDEAGETMVDMKQIEP